MDVNAVSNKIKRDSGDNSVAAPVAGSTSFSSMLLQAAQRGAGNTASVIASLSDMATPASSHTADQVAQVRSNVLANSKNTMAANADLTDLTNQSDIAAQAAAASQAQAQAASQAAAEAESEAQAQEQQAARAAANKTSSTPATTPTTSSASAATAPAKQSTTSATTQLDPSLLAFVNLYAPVVTPPAATAALTGGTTGALLAATTPAAGQPQGQPPAALGAGPLTPDATLAGQAASPATAGLAAAAAGQTQAAGAAANAAPTSGSAQAASLAALAGNVAGSVAVTTAPAAGTSSAPPVAAQTTADLVPTAALLTDAVAQAQPQGSGAQTGQQGSPSTYDQAAAQQDALAAVQGTPQDALSFQAAAQAATSTIGSAGTQGMTAGVEDGAHTALAGLTGVGAAKSSDASALAGQNPLMAAPLAGTAGAQASAAASSTTGTDQLARQAAYPNAAEQVKVQIQKAVKDGVDTINVQLRPEELGRIDVKMELANGAVKATITADRPETLALLQSDSSSLQQALQSVGLSADSNSLSFQLNDQSNGQLAFQQQQQQQQQRNQGGAAPSWTSSGDAAGSTAAATAATGSSAAGGLDISV